MGDLGSVLTSTESWRMAQCVSAASGMPLPAMRVLEPRTDTDRLVNARRERSVSGVSDESEFFVLPNRSIRHCPTPLDFGTLIPLSEMILYGGLTDGQGFNTQSRRERGGVCVFL